MEQENFFLRDINDVIREANELFQNGKTIREVSDVLGIDYSVAYAMHNDWINTKKEEKKMEQKSFKLKDYGLDRRIKIFPEDEEKIQKMYEQGKSIKEIAGEFNVSPFCIRGHLDPNFYKNNTMKYPRPDYYSSKELRKKYRDYQRRRYQLGIEIGVIKRKYTKYKMTNHGWIKKMSDEDLAEFLTQFITSDQYMEQIFHGKTGKSPYECILEWLNKRHDNEYNFEEEARSDYYSMEGKK